MTHIVSGVVQYDKKRWKVTLDDGAVTFLLYRGEVKQAGIQPPRLLPDGSMVETGEQEISEEAWQQIKEEILLPRGKKRALFYLKNGDKTEFQIKSKLKEGFYPEEIIGQVMEFLRKYRLADDARYTENYVNQMKGVRSRREIEAKLYAKGLKGNAVKESLAEIPQEDEYLAAEKALKKHVTGDRRKDYAYLARRGFSADAVEHAMNRLHYNAPGEETFDT